MNRKQLADKYKISDKTLGRRMRDRGLFFGSVQILLPDQVRQIIEALGPWEIILDDTYLDTTRHNQP